MTIMDPNILACPEHLELMEQIIRTGAKVDINQGFDIRLTDDDEIEMINRMRTEKVHFAWDNPYDELEERFVRYTEKGKKKSQGGYGMVYILTNYGSSMEQDYYRVTFLAALGYDPYIMIFDKPHADRERRLFQRWVNNKFIFKSCEWKDYNRR